MTIFEDLPSTNTPINATNLNNNFSEVDGKIDSEVQTLNDEIDRVEAKIPTYGKGIVISKSNIDALKTYMINDAPIGMSMVYVSLNGAAKGCLVMKASSSYLSFIYFSYGDTAKQYKYTNGTWSEVNL